MVPEGKLSQRVSFGEQLRFLREAAGLTQEQLAERAGLTAKGISALERGQRRRPYRHTILALAGALGLSEAERDFLASSVPSRVTASVKDTPSLSNTSLLNISTPLMGRKEDAADVALLITTTSLRLLTLTGTGGVGKTRLAFHVASQTAHNFKGGFVFVPLASLTDPGLVIPSLAAALQLREAAGQPVRNILYHYLQDRHLLLVLDNFEHLLDAAAEIAALLAACHEIKILVTSRAPLHLSSERVYPVKPLGLPTLTSVPQVAEVRQSPAVDLFVYCAKAVVPDFELTQANATSISAICRRLDGLPLAIELAAARIKLLAPTAILARLDRALPLLSGGPRDAPARQQTMRQTVAWSYDLLSESEQRLFRFLSVFAGGWTLEAVEVLCQQTQNPDEVLEGLTSLLDKNLVVRSEDPYGEPRFDFLETIRAYALEQLEAEGELDRMHQRHAEYYLAFAEACAPELKKPSQAFWLDHLAQEQGNINHALGWYHSHEDPESMIRMAWALWHFWHNRLHVSEVLQWLEKATRLLGDMDGELRAQVNYVTAVMLFQSGQYDRVADVLEECLACIDESRLEILTVSYGLYGFARVAQGRLAEAVQLFNHSLEAAKTLGDTVQEGVVLSGLAQVALLEGDVERADRSLERAGQLLRAAGAPWELGLYLNTAGLVPQMRGDHRQAVRLLLECISLFFGMRSSSVVYPLESLSHSFAELGAFEMAACILGAADAARETTGTYGHLSESLRQIHLHYIERVKEELGEAKMLEAWQEGQRHPLREIFNRASNAFTAQGS